MGALNAVRDGSTNSVLHWFRPGRQSTGPVLPGQLGEGARGIGVQRDEHRQHEIAPRRGMQRGQAQVMHRPPCTRLRVRILDETAVLPCWGHRRFGPQTPKRRQLLQLRQNGRQVAGAAMPEGRAPEELQLSHGDRRPGGAQQVGVAQSGVEDQAHGVVADVAKALIGLHLLA